MDSCRAQVVATFGVLTRRVFVMEAYRGGHSKKREITKLGYDVR